MRTVFCMGTQKKPQLIAGAVQFGPKQRANAVWTEADSWCSLNRSREVYRRQNTC